ncbi:MAG: hypothetical protein COV36_05905 [Alphaproteobacteria bacterium CG11_big_fil_rev_8_21_14_0_20_44_7]|nr:MAG: hypothetical protein COV36_05905 [Alphaproteobacteria bacterium CG11_big_fil_rev_8_21_14_0_20_44_7]
MIMDLTKRASVLVVNSDHDEFLDFEVGLLEYDYSISSVASHQEAITHLKSGVFFAAILVVANADEKDGDLANVVNFIRDECSGRAVFLKTNTPEKFVEVQDRVKYFFGENSYPQLLRIVLDKQLGIHRALGDEAKLDGDDMTVFRRA